jgi:hypothetical protein
MLRDVSAWIALGALGLTATGCESVEAALESALTLEAPKVALQEVSLAEAPSQQLMRAYFCPRVLSESTPLGLGAELACGQLFGSAPSTEQMKVAFDVRLAVTNPNRVPLPLSSILSTISVSPGQQQSELGSACVSLCSPDDPECGARDAHACPAEATDVTQASEVAQSLGKLLIGEGARLASGQGLGLEAPEVIAQGTLEVVVRFALDPQRLVPVMLQLAKQSARELQQGQPVTFAIPYQLKGVVFSGSLGSAEPLSAPFGPIDGSFQAL